MSGGFGDFGKFPIPDRVQDERPGRVRLRVGEEVLVGGVRVGVVLERWEGYEITVDMLQPSAGFSLHLPGAGRAAWESCKPDSAVQVTLDDAPIVTGFIDDRRMKLSAGGGTVLEVSGRCRAGRLVDESAPLITFGGLGIRQLAEKVCGDWFPKVTLSNARNRRVVAGSAGAGVDGKEPAIDPSPSKHEWKVNPGDSRWHVLSRFLEKGDLLAWSSGDGKELVVGLPNYDQEPQYSFFAAAEASDRRAESNVISCEVLDTTAERYSMVAACGVAKGNPDNVNYSNNLGCRGVAKDDPSTEFGTGRSFLRRKVLLVSDSDVDDNRTAQVRAEREMANRDGKGHVVNLTVRGHDQWRADKRRPTLFAPDTMATVEVEEIGLRGPYLVTSVRFAQSRAEGEITELSLVPKGTRLRI